MFCGWAFSFTSSSPSVATTDRRGTAPRPPVLPLPRELDEATRPGRDSFIIQTTTNLLNFLAVVRALV
jgi:hypothetical protein